MQTRLMYVSAAARGRPTGAQGRVPALLAMLRWEAGKMHALCRVQCWEHGSRLSLGCATKKAVH